MDNQEEEEEEEKGGTYAAHAIKTPICMSSFELPATIQTTFVLPFPHPHPPDHHDRKEKEEDKDK